MNRCYGIQQTGPRGFDKLFSTNWWMRMAQRKFGNVFMELAALYDYKLKEHTLLSFYAVPMGGPGHGGLLRILIGPPPRKIRWHRWGTIYRTPPTLQGT